MEGVCSCIVPKIFFIKFFPSCDLRREHPFCWWWRRWFTSVFFQYKLFCEMQLFAFVTTSIFIFRPTWKKDEIFIESNKLTQADDVLFSFEKIWYNLFDGDSLKGEVVWLVSCLLTPSWPQNIQQTRCKVNLSPSIVSTRMFQLYWEKLRVPHLTSRLSKLLHIMCRFPFSFSGAKKSFFPQRKEKRICGL